MEELNKDQIAELESLRAFKAEIEKQEPVRPDWYQNPISEKWFECPDDAQILEDIGPVKVGDVIELDVCWNGKQKFSVAKIADEQSDDVELELVEGTKLYAAPVVSPDVEKLKAKPAENYFELACHEYRQQIQSLKAELEAARKDAERLDWLLSHSDATVCSDGVYGPFHIWFRYSNRTTDDAPTARAAIDAAIEQAKGGV